MIGAMRGKEAFVVYLASVIVALTGGVIVLEFSYTAFLDTCDSLHETPNSVGGWIIAAAVIGVILLVGVTLVRRRDMPIWMAVIGVAVCALIMFWLLRPAGSCAGISVDP